MSRLLIVAGTYAQAMDRAASLGLEPREWVYASHPDALRGWLPSRIEYCGTYRYRRDWYELQDELQVMESRMTWAGRKR